MKAQRGIKYGCTLYLTSALDVGGSLTPRPGRCTTKNGPVPIVVRRYTILISRLTWPCLDKSGFISEMPVLPNFSCCLSCG